MRTTCSRSSEFSLYSQDGYSPFASYSPSLSAIILQSFSFSACFAVLLLERREKPAFTSSSGSICSVAKFREVSTSPGRSLLIACTPFGASKKKDMTRKKSDASIAFSYCFSAFSSLICKPDSFFAHSSRKEFSTTPISFFSSSSFAPQAICAFASYGMTLSFVPPSIVITRTSSSRSIRYRSSQSSLLALALPRPISTPE